MLSHFIQISLRFNQIYDQVTNRFSFDPFSLKSQFSQPSFHLISTYALSFCSNLAFHPHLNAKYIRAIGAGRRRGQEVSQFVTPFVDYAPLQKKQAEKLNRIVYLCQKQQEKGCFHPISLNFPQQFVMPRMMGAKRGEIRVGVTRYK